MIKANSTEDGIEKAAQTVEFNGLGHSAAIHTTNHEISKAFGKRIKAIRIIETLHLHSVVSVQYTMHSYLH